MTGHTGGVGTIIYQPIPTWFGLGNRVGTIDLNPPLNNRFSDAAFVGNPTRPVINTIWPNRTIMGWRASWDTPPGTFVDMEGMITGHSWGIIVARWYTHTDTQGTLLEQVAAALHPIPTFGDSGAPIFSWESDPNRVRVCGVVVAINHTAFPNHGTVTIYSPVDGIQRDLTLIWGPP